MYTHTFERKSLPIVPAVGIRLSTYLDVRMIVIETSLNFSGGHCAPGVSALIRNDARAVCCGKCIQNGKRSGNVLPFAGIAKQVIRPDAATAEEHGG